MAGPLFFFWFSLLLLLSCGQQRTTLRVQTTGDNMARKATNRRLIVSIQQRGGNKANHAAIESHVRAVLAEMCSTRLANTMRITVKMRAGISAPNANGVCHWRDMGRTSTARSKHYTIEVQRDTDFETQLVILTHELQHAVQMAQGRLAFRRGSWFWRAVGQTGPATRYDRDSTYWSQPWEVEAREAADSTTGTVTGRYAHLIRQTIAK